jgi:4-hydroxy-4-methyl-2-oxoglutarate aldolase
VIPAAEVTAGVNAAEQLAGLSAATVHEAQGRRGAFPSRLTLRTAPEQTLRAPAMTVSTQPGENLTLHRALYQTPPGWALLVVTSESLDYGYWGEVLNTAAMTRGVAGLVIDGGIRDSAQMYGAGMPIFSSRVCIRGTAKHGGGSYGETVAVGDVIVRRGDILVGDADGVVAVRAEEAANVAAASRLRDGREAEYMSRIRSGASTLEIFGWNP